MTKYTSDYLYDLILLTGKRENTCMRRVYKRAFRMLPQKSLELIGHILEQKEIRFYSTTDSYVLLKDVRCANKPKKPRPCVYIEYGCGSQIVFHEIGHAVDVMFTGDNLSTSYVLKDGVNTFASIALEELRENHQKIYDYIMSGFKSVVIKEVGEEKYNNVIKHLRLHSEFRQLDAMLKGKDHIEYANAFKKRDKLMHWLEKHGYIEDFIDVILLNGAYKFNIQNYPLIDAVGAFHDLSILGFVYHTFEYYKYRLNIASEMFANLFSAKVLDETLTLDTFESFMPKSFKAFNEIFSVIEEQVLQPKKKKKAQKFVLPTMGGENQCNSINA